MTDADYLEPSGRQPWTIAVWLVVAAVVGTGIFWFSLGLENGGGFGESKPLPDLSLEPLTGDSSRVTLAGLHGKVAMVNIWGTWCPPCRAEFPHIVVIHRKYQRVPDFKLLAVSSGGDKDDNLTPLRKTTEEFLTERQATDLPTYADQGFRTRLALKNTIGFRGYPTTVVLDRNGTIRGSWVGFQPGQEHEMTALVDTLLAEKPAPKETRKTTAGEGRK